MLKFKSFLQEYRKAPLGQEFSKSNVINLLADEDNVELLRTHMSVDGKDFIIAEYSFDSNNKMFAIINRVDNSDIAGYLIIKKFINGWQDQDVCIYAPYRNKGLGIDLYVKIIQMGIDMISGFSLSNEAEKLWTEKLPKFVNVSVIDIDGKIENFSNKPALDNKADSEQTLFYFATTRNKVKTGLDENYLTSDGMNNLLYENWIRNIGAPTRSWRSSKFGEKFEF